MARILSTLGGGLSARQTRQTPPGQIPPRWTIPWADPLGRHLPGQTPWAENPPHHPLDRPLPSRWLLQRMVCILLECILVVLYNFENRLDSEICDINYNSKYYGKFKFTLKLIRLLTVCNWYPLEVEQKCQHWQLCVLREKFINLVLKSKEQKNILQCQKYIALISNRMVAIPCKVTCGRSFTFEYLKKNWTFAENWQQNEF